MSEVEQESSFILSLNTGNIVLNPWLSFTRQDQNDFSKNKSEFGLDEGT